MLTFVIYLIGILDAVKGSLIIAMLILGLASVICGFVLNDAYQEEEVERLTKLLKKLLGALVTVATLFCFIPNSRTVAAMYLIPKIANNEMVNQIPEKALNVLNKKLDGWLEEEKK